MSLQKQDLYITSLEQISEIPINIGDKLITSEIVMGDSSIGATPDGTLNVNSMRADANYWYISVRDVFTQSVTYYKIALAAP